MIKLKDSTLSPYKQILNVFNGKTSNMEIVVTNGKITYITYDESKLTAAEKTAIDNILSSNNPNLA